MKTVIVQDVNVRFLGVNILYLFGKLDIVYNIISKGYEPFGAQLYFIPSGGSREVLVPFPLKTNSGLSLRSGSPETCVNTATRSRERF